ncbi:MAG: hypothetical protein ACXVEF_31705 [Polyangiales bacterium]
MFEVWKPGTLIADRAAAPQSARSKGMDHLMRLHIFAIIGVATLGCAVEHDSEGPAASNAQAIGYTSAAGLAFYRRTASDTFWTANVDSSGNEVSLAGTPGIGNGWTHLVGLGYTNNPAIGTGAVFFYNRTNHDAAIGTIDLNGVFHQTHSWPGSGSPAFGTWDKIVQLPGLHTLFYRWDGTVGSAALVNMSGNAGTATTDKSWSSGYGNWTAISGGVDGTDSVVFYNSSSGTLIFGKYGGAPSYTLDSRATTIATGYDQVASAGSTVLFYNSSSGALEWGVPSLATGTYVRKGSTTYVAGMTQVAARENGEYVFLRKSDGFMITARFDSNGSHVDQQIYTASTGWDIMTSAGDYYAPAR